MRPAGKIHSGCFSALFRHDHARKILVGERRAVRGDNRGGDAVGQRQAAAQGQPARKAQQRRAGVRIPRADGVDHARGGLADDAVEPAVLQAAHAIRAHGGDDGAAGI